MGVNSTLENFQQQILDYLATESSQIGKGQTLLATSDIIESIFGKYKRFSSLCPLKEMGQITHQVKSRLNLDQQLELKRMILEQQPTDYGIDRYIWTGKILASVIKKRWGVNLKCSRIYEILDSLKLSYQKAHRDYDNADSEQQKKFVETLKKNCCRSQESKK